MFKLNDRVFYPGHGVALIEDIMEKVVSDKKMKFFKLKFLYKDMTILIPYRGDVNSGIRRLSDQQTIDKAIAELSKEPLKKNTFLDYAPNSWNKRNRDYQFRLQSGDLLDMVKIYRDLMFFSKDKELSFGEKKLLKTIKDLLLEEFVVVKNCDKESVLQILQNPFQQMQFINHASNVTTFPSVV